MKRKTISKKNRFEVFKRDKFSCQYCGASAPEAVLEIDHIVPIASGGDSSVMNLITACFSCNRGKSYRELSDNSTLTKQKKQLDNLQERKEQLELLAKWRKGLTNLNSETTKIIADEINLYLGSSNLVISEFYKKSFSSWLKKFTLKEILIGIDSAAEIYLKPEGEGYTLQSINVFQDKILKTISLNKYYDEKPYMRNVFYLRAIGKNRFEIREHHYNQLNESKKFLENKFIELVELLNGYETIPNAEKLTEQQRLRFYRELSNALGEVTKTAKNYNNWLDEIADFDIENFYFGLFEKEFIKNG